MFELTTISVTQKGKQQDYKVLMHPGAAAVLAIRDQQVLLVEQYRPAVASRLLEIPAGTLEAGERPEECATRELEEETGFRAESLTSLGSVLLAPGYSSELLYLFLAESLLPGHQKLDESEDLEVQWFPLDRLRSMVISGEISDAKTCCAVLRYQALERS